MLNVLCLKYLTIHLAIVRAHSLHHVGLGGLRVVVKIGLLHLHLLLHHSELVVLATARKIVRVLGASMLAGLLEVIVVGLAVVWVN